MSNLEIILKGCKQYNKTAQRELYNLYSPVIRGICFRYLGNKSDVKDLLQECFLKIFLNIKKYSKKGSFEGWIKRIAVNTAIDFYNKSAKNNHIDFDTVYNYSETSDENKTDLIDVEIDYKDIDKNKIDYNMVVNADFSETDLINILNSIPYHYRIVFNLYCIEHFKHKEIAKKLKIDENTSRTRLIRARNIIQNKLYEKSIQKLAKS